jgi:hypothetical protein
VTQDSTALDRVAAKPRPASLKTHHEISQFLYREARLLDEERFRDWIGMLTTDIHYWLPLRENRFRKDRRPAPEPHNCASVYNDDYTDLDMRVKRLETGLVWTEDPPPRFNRIIANIEVEATDKHDELAVYSNVLLYRNRRQDEEVWFSAKRRDRVRAVDGTWKICQRHIFVSHHLFTDENVSVFF